MNDAIKIYIGVAFRYLVVIICAKIGFEKAEADKLLDPATIAVIAGGLATMLYGLYTTLKSKMSQKIALELPKGSEPERIQRVAKQQPISAVLTTEPK